MFSKSCLVAYLYFHRFIGKFNKDYKFHPFIYCVIDFNVNVNPKHYVLKIRPVVKPGCSKYMVLTAVYYYLADKKSVSST